MFTPQTQKVKTGDKYYPQCYATTEQLGHQTTGETPANYQTTKLPSVQSKEQPNDTQVRERDSQTKQQSKEYAD